MTDDTADLLDDLRGALSKHAPGGMVGTFVVVAELYDEDGQPQMHTLTDMTGTSWTQLGMAHAAVKIIESRFSDEGDE